MWQGVRNLFRRRGQPRPSGGQSRAPVVARRAEWQSLPPLRTPLQTPVPEISGTTRFASGLAERNAPPTYLAPLGHDVRPSAPRGTATGIARVVLPSASDRVHDLPLGRRLSRRDRDPAASAWASSTPDPTPEPTPPPAVAPTVATAALNRSPDGEAAPRDRSSGADPLPLAAAPVDGSAAEGSSPSPEPADTPPASVPPTVAPSVAHTPIRVLRAAAPSRPANAPTSPPARPGGLPLRPLGVQRSATSAVAGSAVPPASVGAPAPASSTPTDATTAPLVSDPSKHADATPPPTVSLADDTTPSSPTGTTSDPSTPPAVPLRRGGATRGRTGLGAPLDALPPTARGLHETTPRSATPAVTGSGRQEAIDRGLQRLMRAPSPPAPSTESLATGPPPPTASPLAATARPHPDLSVPPVVARRIELPDRPLGPAAAPAPTRPLAGMRPPLVDAPIPPAADDDAPEPTVEPVPVRWTTPPVAAATEPASTAAPPRREAASPSSTTPGPIASTTPASRSAGPAATVRAAPASTPSSPSAGSGGRHPTQRSTEPSAPGRSANRLPPAFDGHPLVQRLRASRTEAPPAPAVTTPDAPRTRLPLATPVHRHAEPSPSVPAPSPNGATPTAAATPTPTVIQRSVEIDEVTTTAHPADEATAGPDVEELFHELYPRVRDELRWELRVQRERVGLLSDPL